MGQASRRARRALAFIAVAAIVAVPAALGGAAETPDSIYTAPDIGSGLMVDETPAAWFVQLSGSPATFRSNAKAAGLDVKQRFEYSKLWKGVSVAASSDDMAVVTRMPGVEAIFPVIAIDRPETSSDNTPDLATAINMTGANNAHSSGYTGAGVKVAVMDTGVDYDHPDLGGCFGAGCRVAMGHDFVGDAFNADSTAASYNPVTTPDDDPDDCQGHGTHVAGIVGANGAVKGVAPDVTFGAYRVFGCVGSTTADVMLAAMEAALEDDMDILNMSIGSAFMTWPQYPTAVGADALVDNGMIVVASIGNSGANGMYSAGAPGVGNKVIGVGSVENSHVSALSFRTNPANTKMAYLQIGNSETAPTSGTTPEVVYLGRGCPQSGPSWSLPAADPYPSSPAGKIALIDRGICTFEGKYQRAIDAGAVGVVVANNTAGPFAGGGITNRGYPAVGISQADGTTLKAELAAGPVTLTWTNERTAALSAVGGTMASSSSAGMTAELKVKPNISAPGALIRSTYPLEQGSYAILSGTSMASPHVAGAAALLLQAKPTTTPSQAQVVFQNSADPVPFQASRTFLEVIHRQGAGLIDIDDSIAAKATVSPSEISIGEGAGGTYTLTVTNNGSSAVTYTLANQAALSSGGDTNAPGYFVGNAAVVFGAPSVTVPAGGSASVTATIAKPLAQGQQYGGFIRLSGDDASVLRVPYAGFSGDYQAIQVLTPTTFGFPWLAKRSGNTYTKQNEGAVYTMVGDDIPYFAMHFEHQVRQLSLTVLDAATGEPFAGKGANKRNPTFLVEDYLARNSTSTAFFAWGWNGTLTRTVDGSVGDIANKVPEGTYKVKVSVLKALGDPANPAHTESWTSPSFTIDRP